MASGAVPDASLRRCRHCGALIGAAPFAREGAEYCCEACFLATRRSAVLGEAPSGMTSELAEALACALDAREHETGLHSRRVACHTLVLARRFSGDAGRLQQVYWGALLHDIGKIGIPDAVLLKRGPLAPEEWHLMRTHPEIGHRVLAGVPSLAEAAQLVLAHEERYDGSGYPRGLAGDAIPLWARLFAVIDALDAVTSERPYRRARSFAEAKDEIVRGQGSQFDPIAVQVFLDEAETLAAMVALKCDRPYPG